MKTKTYIASLTLALTLGLTAGIGGAQAYTVKGMGGCDTWVGGQDDRFWILGFISGANWSDDANHAKGIDVKNIYKFVSRYCEKNPSGDLADATIAYITTQ